MPTTLAALRTERTEHLNSAESLIDAEQHQVEQHFARIEHLDHQVRDQ